MFNTIEGGAIVCPDAKTKQRIDHLKNFGIVDETTVVAPGINGKMSEINAAFGMLQLQYIEQALERRREIATLYRRKLSSVRGIDIISGKKIGATNYSYFPILVQPEYPITRDELYQKLKEHNIFSRRYFYPLITNFPMYRGLASARPDNLPVAEDIASKVLCLPIHPALTKQESDRVIKIISDI